MPQIPTDTPALSPARLVSAPRTPQGDLGHGSIALRVGVHDRSRLEWVATVPVAPPGEQHTWRITLEAEIPDAMWLHHNPWDHFTVRSRLTSPTLEPGRKLIGPPIDQLRRQAMTAAHLLKGATIELIRPLKELRRVGEALDERQAHALAGRLELAAVDARAARETLGQDYRSADDTLTRELRLAEEFVSNQILMLITEFARVLGSPRASTRKPQPGVRGHTEPVRRVLSELLATETQWRREAGVRWPVIKEVNEIEGFIQRAALLKKHFQQALFLEARAYMLDQRLRNWIAMIMAMIASSFYFVWQVWILNNAMSSATTTNSLVIAGLIAGLIYAGKDRIKEVGREWVTKRVRLHYGDRVAHLRLQERMDPKRSKFGLARETIVVNRRPQADALNPALGATQVTHHLQVVEKLGHTGLPVLYQQGLVGLKHVFRYDLSPLLVKLDDQHKRVPVASADGVHIRAATRVYMIAIKVRLERIGTDVAVEHSGFLRLRRSGLERFVEITPAKDRPRRQRVSSPALRAQDRPDPVAAARATPEVTETPARAAAAE